MGIQLVLFDLDDTLLQTGDLADFRGRLHVNDRSPAYTQQLLAAYDRGERRARYSPQTLDAIRLAHPGRKLGVFTRAPGHYARTLLQRAYPQVRWDVIVAYEDVRSTKPNPDGVWLAMKLCGIKQFDNVAMVGDDKVDIQAAYNAGCWAFLDRGAWPERLVSDNYYALERVPDVVVINPGDLCEKLEEPVTSLPELERAGYAGQPSRTEHPRFDTINHFAPHDLALKSSWVTVLGRMFSHYEQLKYRASWHPLTAAIIAHKETRLFPAAWISSLKLFLELCWPIANGRDTVVTVVPFKPGRFPRLESLLDRLESSHEADPIPTAGGIDFFAEVLAYREGVRGHSTEHLSKEQRFVNVRDHLFVAAPERVLGKHVVVIDDVVTTGASLIYAQKYLMDAGARNVTCVALAKAVGIG
jgi:phosphoglycolate phosphatase-like HAD superfamily hydrolase